ncbi:MAG: prepilin-type N-terminal cleavage/methylation domain-containing protein [Candidatus Nanopelagicales bacterium]
MGIATWRAVAGRRHDDDGVSLIEVMVALGLMVVLAAGIASSLLLISKSAFTSKERSAAANLATREVEVVRNWFHSSDTAPLAVMSAGDTTNGSPLPGQTGALVVDNVPYTVTRTLSWLVAGAGQSACDGGAVVSYPSVGVHVEVTWPNMGDIPPVVSDTILTPPKSVLNAGSGYLAVKVINRRGNPNVNRIVQASGPGGVYTEKTGADGCAVFVLSSAGTYTITMMEGASGYISFNGSTSQTAPVTAGNLVTRSFTYDLGVKYNVTLTPPGGYNLPQTLPAVTFGNAGILPAGIASYPSSGGGTTLVGPLWPFVSGYSVWASSCPDSDPALDPAGRPTAYTPSKGSTTNVPAQLQGVSLLTTRLGSPVGATVTATYTGPGTCTAGDNVLVLGSSDSGTGELYTSLPYGAWTLTTQISGQTVTVPVDVSSSGAVVATLNGTV